MASPGLRRTRRIQRAGSGDDGRRGARTLDAPHEALATILRRALETDASTGEARILSLSVPAGNVSLLDWLRAQEVGPKLYWSGRDDGVEVAAVGVADESFSTGDRLPLLDDAESDARYYGGMRFDTDSETSGEWAAFGTRRFVLPRFELRREGGEAVLICNLVLPGDTARAERILRQVEDLQVAEARSGVTLPTPVERLDLPDATGWRTNIEKALAAFESGPLKKVVLARRVDLSFDGVLDPLLLIEKLKARTPGCFHFYFEPEAGVAFLGASPERLYRREERSIKSEAVAGTRPRGESAADDEDLGEELLTSAKDLTEHAYVRVSIEEKLDALCERLEVEERASEMKLARGRHLVSRVRGTLRDAVTDPDVLRALHPTPAVGGYSREDALKEIRASEPFDRGWYAGPIGWIGAESAEFAVGIRSGLVRGRELSLYSGAGIVPGSVPEEEWAEIEQKIGDFTQIFGLEPAYARS